MKTNRNFQQASFLDRYFGDVKIKPESDTE